MPLGSAEAGTDGSFMVTFPGPAPDSVDLEAQTDGVPASRRLTERRARALGRVVVPEPGDPPMENAYLALSPTAGTAPCSGYRCGVHAIADRAGRVAFNTTELTDSSAYEMVGVSSGSEPTLDAKADLYNEAYADSKPSQVAIPVSGPTVELPVAVLTGPNLMGMSRDSLGALIPDVEIWGSNDRGEPRSGDLLRNFGNRRGRYGVHLADGRWRIDPRPPRGCDPMATDAFDVVVTAGTAVPNVVDLTWRVTGVPVDTTITLARLRETGSSLPVVLDMGSPAGDLTLSFSDLLGEGSVSAGCRSATLPVGPGGEIPIDLPVAITPSGLSFNRAELCLSYVPERAAAADVPESGLRLLHERQDGSTEVLPSVVDTVSRQVCATTTSFSAFAVGGRATTTTTSPTTSTTTTSTTTTTMSTTTTPTPPSPTSTSPTTSAPRPTSPVTLPAHPVPPPTTVSRSGYWMVGADGIVYGFGDARRLGDAPVGSTPAVDLEPTPSGDGYWVADAQGHVFSAGDARYLGGGELTCRFGDSDLPLGDSHRSRVLVVHHEGPGSCLRRRWLLRRHGRDPAQRPGAGLGPDVIGPRLLHGVQRRWSLRLRRRPLSRFDGCRVTECPSPVACAGSRRCRLLASGCRRRHLKLRGRVLRIDGTIRPSTARSREWLVSDADT